MLIGLRACKPSATIWCRRLVNNESEAVKNADARRCTRAANEARLPVHLRDRKCVMRSVASASGMVPTMTTRLSHCEISMPEDIRRAFDPAWEKGSEKHGKAHSNCFVGSGDRRAAARCRGRIVDSRFLRRGLICASRCRPARHSGERRWCCSQIDTQSSPALRLRGNLLASRFWRARQPPVATCVRAPVFE
jgi:hypothetical protein